MYIFCDTEFTDFKYMDLISLGLVSEDGQHEFYVEISDHVERYRSDFVNRVVVPLLDPTAHGKPYAEAVIALSKWIDDLPTEHINLVVDYVGDQTLIERMLQQSATKKVVRIMLLMPSFTYALHGRGAHTEAHMKAAVKQLVCGMQQYFNIDNRQHHALVDAKATRHGWITGMQAVL